MHPHEAAAALTLAAQGAPPPVVCDLLEEAGAGLADVLRLYAGTPEGRFLDGLGAAALAEWCRRHEPGARASLLLPGAAAHEAMPLCETMPLCEAVLRCGAVLAGRQAPPGVTPCPERDARDVKRLTLDLFPGGREGERCGRLLKTWPGGSVLRPPMGTVYGTKLTLDGELLPFNAGGSYSVDWRGGLPVLRYRLPWGSLVGKEAGASAGPDWPTDVDLLAWLEGAAGAP